MSNEGEGCFLRVQEGMKVWEGERTQLKLSAGKPGLLQSAEIDSHRTYRQGGS